MAAEISPAANGRLTHAGASLDFSIYLVSPASDPSSPFISQGPYLVRERVRARRARRRSLSADPDCAVPCDDRSTDLPSPPPALDVLVSPPGEERKSVTHVSDPGKAPAIFPGFSATPKSSQGHTSRTPTRAFTANESERSRVSNRSIPVASVVVPHEQPRVRASSRPAALERPAILKPIAPIRSRSANLESLHYRLNFTSYIFTHQYEDVSAHYWMEEKLGRGANGEVWRCVESSTGHEWACKTIKKRHLVCQDDVDALLAEVAVLRALGDHAAVASLHDLMEDEQNVFLILELCKGGELFDAIVRRKRYPEPDAARVIRAIVSVVHYMQSKGFMHRDVKPENVVLLNRESDTNVRVIDFGQAVSFRPGEKLTTFVGSAFYVAPEVLQHSYGPEADIWSMGVVLYILLSGSPPFHDMERAEIFRKIETAEVHLDWGPWKRVSNGAKDLVHRMLNRDPSQRITTAQIKNHPWILQYCQPRLLLPLPLLINVSSSPQKSLPKIPLFQGTSSTYPFPSPPALPQPGSARTSSAILNSAYHSYLLKCSKTSKSQKSPLSPSL